MKKRYYDYDALCGAMHDIVLKNGAKHRCIDAGMILDLPKADVVERKKGKWIRDGHHVRCDQCEMYMCDKDSEGDRIPLEFCPNCGADMREEETNGDNRSRRNEND